MQSGPNHTITGVAAAELDMCAWLKDDCHAVMTAAQSGQRAGVADGWQLVPKEPTKAMLDAAERLDWSSEDVRGNCCNQWNAMLAAVPTQQQEGGNV